VLLRRGRPLFCLLALFLSGCALERSFTAEPATHFARECAPPLVSAHTSPTLSQAETPQGPQIESFTPRFHRVAAAVGVLSLLHRVITLERERVAKKEGAELELIRVRQQILARTVLAMLEATSLSAVVRCELARADQLADSLAEKQAKSTQLATIVSLIIESATMIATGGLILAGHEVAEGIAALVGGSIAASLAGISLYRPARHEFDHPRNILKEIWENPSQAQYFPEAVWRFLNEPTEDGKSLREHLVASWRELSRIEGQSEAKHQERINLLFGSGGTYTIEDLRSRAAMLEMLAAAIDLMHDELEVMVREMVVREEERKQ
jgi:hypothetical protein